MQNKSHVRCLTRDFFWWRGWTRIVYWTVALQAGLKKNRKCCLLLYKKPAIFLFIAFLCFSAVSKVKIWLFLLFVVDATATVAIFPWIDSIPLSLSHTRSEAAAMDCLTEPLTRPVGIRGHRKKRREGGPKIVTGWGVKICIQGGGQLHGTGWGASPPFPPPPCPRMPVGLAGIVNSVLVLNIVVPSFPMHFEPGKCRVSSHGQWVTNSSKKVEYVYFLIFRRL